MHHERLLANSTGEVNTARTAYEAAAVRHTTTTARSKGRAEDFRQTSPYADETTQGIVEDLPKEIEPYVAMDAVDDFYQPFQPWDAFTPQHGINPGGTFGHIVGLARAPGTRAALADGQVLDYLQTVRNMVHPKTTEFKGRMAAGRSKLLDFRRRNQPGYDLFHGLVMDAEKTGNYDDLARIHDEIFEAAFDAKTGTLIDDDTLVNWLLMESRAGMPFALPADVIEPIAMRLMAKNGVLPHNGLKMFNPTYTPRKVARHLRIEPQIQGLYSGKPSRGGTWFAEPDPEWVTTGVNFWHRAYRRIWRRSNPLFTKKKNGLTDLTRMTRLVTSNIEAITQRWGKWLGSPVRLSVLEVAAEGISKRTLKGGKFLNKKVEREFKGLYIRYLERRIGGVQDGFKLDAEGARLVNETTGEALGLQADLRVADFDTFMKAFDGKQNPAKILGDDITTELDNSLRNGLMPSDNPMEATMMYLTDRQFWGGGSYVKSLRYLDEMTGFGMRDETIEMLTDIHGPQIANFRHELTMLGDDVAQKGLGDGGVLDTARGKFLLMLMGKTKQQVIDEHAARTWVKVPDRVGSDGTVYKGGWEDVSVDVTRGDEAAVDAAEKAAAKEAEDAANLGVHEAARDDAFVNEVDELAVEATHIVDDVRGNELLSMLQAGGMRKSARLKKIQSAIDEANHKIANIKKEPVSRQRNLRLKAAKDDLARAKRSLKTVNKDLDADWAELKRFQQRIDALASRMVNAALDPINGDIEAVRTLMREMVGHSAFSSRKIRFRLSQALQGKRPPPANHLDEAAYQVRAANRIVKDSADKIAARKAAQDVKNAALKARIKAKRGIVDEPKTVEPPKVVDEADELKKTQKQVQEAYDEGNIKKGQELQEKAETLSAKTGKGGLQDTEVMRLEADINREMDKMSDLSKKMEPDVAEYERLRALGDDANAFEKQRLIALGRKLDGRQNELDALANEVAFLQKQLADIPAARKAASKKKMIDQTLSDIEQQKAAKQVAAHDESIPLPNEEMREVPLGGPADDVVVETRATVLAYESGVTETQWLRGRQKQNRRIINSPKSSKEAVVEAKAANREISRALRNIRKQKYNETYKAPPVRWDDAQNAADELADTVAGVVPPKLIAYYAVEPLGMLTEMARSVHVMLKRHPIVNGGMPGLTKFQPQHWESITDEVAEAVRRVQPKRTSPLGLRTVKDEAIEETEHLLKTRRDSKPVVVQAKKAALRDVQTRLGIPLKDQITVDEYDRIRTLLQPHIGRKNRGMKLMAKAKADPDYRKAFLEARRATADKNAADNIAWTMLENPGMTAEDAAAQVRASWYVDGTIRPEPVNITEMDANVLRRFFEHTTGANMDDEDAVIAALNANGTAPPMNNKHSFTTHQQETGAWSPRALDVVHEKGTWSLEEETTWWMQNYGRAPRWLTDERLLDGTAMADSKTYMAVMGETGNFDESARVARELGPSKEVEMSDLVHGNPEKGLSPPKTWAEERQYMIQRYGNIVNESGDGVTLTNAPWLMTPDELGAYAAKHNLTEIPGVIKHVDDIKAIQEATKQVATRYADVHIGLNAAEEVITDPDTIQLMAFEGVRNLAHTSPWRSAKQAIKDGGGKGAANKGLELWRKFWTYGIVSNPAFTALNATDIPLRGAWFGVTDQYARAGMRVSQKTLDAIPTTDAVGLGGATGFSHGYPKRGLREIRRNSYGKKDSIGAGFERILTIVPDTVLTKVEHSTKLRLAQQMYEGMSNDVAMLAYKAEKNLSDEEFDLLLKIQIKKRINKWFPTMENAGAAEKLLNTVFPFVSYYAKNQLIWIGEILEHPWAWNTINKWNEQLIDHNVKEWKEQYGEDAQMPEHLRHQIRLPWADDDGTPIFLDIGTFIDATRGMGILTQGAAPDLGALMGRVFRPLPNQMASIQTLLYYGFGAYGRKMYQKVLDENGMWAGEYEQVTLPPGAPWGGNFDFFRDTIWAVDFVQKFFTEDRDFGSTMMTIADMATFGAISRPSRYFMANQQYFALLRTDEEAAREWLDTADGEWLKQKWDESNMELTDVSLNEFALLYGPDGDQIPTEEQIRAVFLKNQPKEWKDPLFAAFEESKYLNQLWDWKAEALAYDDYAGQRDLWQERETFFNQYYAEHPEVPFYWGMGMDRTEMNNWIGQQMIDSAVNDFFTKFDWSKAPSWEDKKARKEWEEQRKAWLEKNPLVKKYLAEHQSSYDKQVDQMQKQWAKAAKKMKEANALRNQGYKTGDERLVELANLMTKGNAIVFDREVFGNDALPGKDPKFRLRPDSLGLKLRAAAGDPVAIREACCR
jgi:hypothetical protein